MVKVVNLRTHKKQKARATARDASDVRAAKFGRTKLERAAEKRDADTLKIHLDGHKRED